MSTDATTDAAIAVMAALQPLSSEERSRVIQSAAALFGVALVQSASAAAASPTAATGDGSGIDHGAAPAAPSGAAAGGKRVSLVELIKEKSPATNAQRIACFAYYREKVEGKPNFSSIDLSSYFSQAKLPAPGSNYARDYTSAVKNAWIHDDGANSYLTQEGEVVVEAGFGGKRKSPKAPAKRKNAKTE